MNRLKHRVADDIRRGSSWKTKTSLERWDFKATGSNMDKDSKEHRKLKESGRRLLLAVEEHSGSRHCFLKTSVLLLLPSQLYLWRSPLWVRCLRMWPFFNPTTEVVTFYLHGWCMLSVFSLPAFTRLGHECQDLLSLCDGMHVCTD